LPLIQRAPISFEAHLASYTVQGALLNVAKRWGFEADHASPYNDRVQNERGYTFNLALGFMAYKETILC